MPEDAKLVTNIKLAKAADKDKPLFFALAMKGGADGALVVDKKKVGATDIKAAKEKCGGSAVAIGCCYAEDGKVVFEMETNPPGTMAKILKTVISRDTGLTLNVLSRLAGAPLPPPPGGPKTEQTQQTKQTEENGAGTKTDPAREAALLSSFKRRQKELLGNAVKASDEVKAKIKAPMAKAVELAGAKKFTEADALLDEIEELLAPSDGGQSDDPAAKEFRTKLAALESRYEAAKKAKKGDVAKMQLAFQFAQDQAAAGSYPSATKALGQLEKLLTAAEATPTPETGKGENEQKDGMFFAMQTARLAWVQAREGARLEVESLEKAIIAEVKACNADPREEEEVDIGDLEKKAKALYTVFDKFDERLADKLDEGLNAKTKELRQAKHTEAKVILKEYMATLATDPFLAQVDNHGFGTTKIRQNFVGVLTDLAKKLT